MNRFSRIFQPINAIAKDAGSMHKDFMSKSQRLMLELGIIHPAVPGCFNFLPLGVKSLNKIIHIIDQEMENIGGEKVIIPTLVKAELWEKSGRFNDMRPELITLEDRHKQKFILGPTHEESISNLVATLPSMSYKKFPLLLYQITSKFRDEMKPRFGLIRGREFLMKDLYSFDIDEKSAQETYGRVCQAYDKIFKRIGVDFIKVLADSGAMGGSLSHEFHYLGDIGDDKILFCQKCSKQSNMELVEENKCPSCGNSSDIKVQPSIEVGHTFFLGDKYSKSLNAIYSDVHNKPQTLQMGSYGIGISRLLAACLECLSLEQELRWPDSIAPYNVAIIPPKSGSKEEALLKTEGEALYKNLESYLPSLRNSVVLDDRTNLTIGRRLLDCRRTGIRYIIVLNKQACQSPPVFELNDIVKAQQIYLDVCGIVNYIKGNGDDLEKSRQPRFGLIRGREFLMKDLYSFDIDEKSALETYGRVCQAYDKIFKRIGVNFIKVLADSGAMGGSLSHEFHYLGDIGDDKILFCQKCSKQSNMELVEENKCPSCGNSSDIKVQPSIEVGHTFFLGDKYSKSLKAIYSDVHNKPQTLQMGSYGIGISRLLAACLECLSLEQELRWPDSIAPYNVAIIPPKSGSKEEAQLKTEGEALYKNLESYLPNLRNSVVLDDRTNLTIGRRLLDCRRTGIRYIIVLNKQACQSPPVFELNDIVKAQQIYLDVCGIVNYIKGNGDHLEESVTSG